DLLAARARRDQAEAGVEQAWSSLLPNVSAQGRYTRNYKQVELDFGAFNVGPSAQPGANTPPPAVIQRLHQLDGVAQLTVPLIVPSAYLSLSASPRTSESAAATSDSADSSPLLQV